jgi:hypothetical protein
VVELELAELQLELDLVELELQAIANLEQEQSCLETLAIQRLAAAITDLVNYLSPIAQVGLE